MKEKNRYTLDHIPGKGYFLKPQHGASLGPFTTTVGGTDLINDILEYEDINDTEVDPSNIENLFREIIALDLPFLERIPDDVAEQRSIFHEENVKFIDHLQKWAMCEQVAKSGHPDLWVSDDETRCCFVFDDGWVDDMISKSEGNQLLQIFLEKEEIGVDDMNRLLAKVADLKKIPPVSVPERSIEAFF